MYNLVGALQVEVDTPYNIENSYRLYTIMIVKSMTYTDSMYI